MSNVQRPMTRVIPIPQNKVGLVIGKKGSQIQEIRNQTGVNITVKDNHAHLRGTAEQCQHAETMIEEILTRPYNKKGGFKKLNVTIPEKFMGFVIGKGRENLNNIETRTGVALKVIDNHLHFKGSTKQEKKVIREVRNMVKTRKKSNAIRFVHVDTAHLKEGHALKLSIAQPSPNTMVGLKCFKLDLEDDPLVEETPSGFADMESLKEKMLGILKQIHKEKEEEMVIVDIWCHFGHAYLINVDEDDENDLFTLEELKDRIESTAGDRWKTFFSEVETIEVEQIEKYLRDCACTTSDDIRYDLTFFTPSGLEVRVKVWLIEKELGAEGASASSFAFRHSAPLPVRNALTHVLPVEHSGDASNSPIFHICETFHQRMKLDILMPSAGFDCRLKIRTFPKSPKTTTLQAEEERNILEKYLMEMSIEDGQLTFPPISKLPDGFDLFYQRRSLRKTYQYKYDGDMFTLTVCKDQSKEVNPDQTDAYSFNESEAKPDVHLHCEEWDQVLNEGNWEPEQIIAKLPKFLEFLRKVQGILPHSNSK
ncbi:uncharacterized protein LOC111340449 [Stylophora pistillata]|uniref:Far upstream element-binding protein 1 n=1 Tax=Stylophora pistillata TaxID=50429 RepID=A0A2B4RN26_STYPI|nr:uncharacterized protein LOC111340449 [Stylophora pistillata]XP_022803032.1 uncharacterized protein LOC111340449 [Stylophora pistillata]PFX17738.1 Far upstream element-binding protein 1 [Stylophora pistillata]